ncbi:MAG: hypothetical protein OXH47_00085 [Paracoccaceae bacterium]|nr:hypothetical protein [Paracoccaceae bacterium]
MKHSWYGPLLALVFAVMLMGAFTGRALAQTQGHSVIIVNDDYDGEAINSVYIWHEESDSIGPNRLVTVLIDRDPPWLFFGNSIEIPLQGGGMRDRCEFFIMIVANDGDRLEGEIDLCQIDYVEFN